MKNILFHSILQDLPDQLLFLYFEIPPDFQNEIHMGERFFIQCRIEILQGPDVVQPKKDVGF
jgi:hypothetical protein